MSVFTCTGEKKMYKILIADDEELEREALRFFINESSLDIDQVIECA